MKKQVSLWIMAGVLCGMVASTGAQDMQEHGAFTTVLVQQIKTIVNADSVLGKPLDFDGTKIIPIVSLGFGFGAGSGVQENTEDAENGEHKEKSGTGGGGGGFVTPQGLLVITKGGEVKVIEARKGIVSEIVKGLAPVILEAIKAKQGVEKKEEPKGPPAKP
jgi:uncharacterized spore protein YtfJ